MLLTNFITVCSGVLHRKTTKYPEYHMIVYIYTEHSAACSNQTQTARVYQNADSSLRKQEEFDPMLFQYCPPPTNGPGPILKQHWSRAVGGGGGGNIETALGQILVFAGLHTGVCLHPSLPSIIFSPADQGTFSKTAGQSQAYYNT